MIRSEIQRDFKRPTPSKEPKVRVKKCRAKACRKPFQPRNSMQTCCSAPCAIDHAVAERVRKERSERQEGLRKLKRRGEHMAEAQTAFNAFIRERDRLAGYMCISSGLPLDWSGNNVDAGHYRSRGIAPHLRFNEQNVHAQSKQQNRYASGNAVDYRIGLIARIGLAAVEALEADQTPRKWSIEELQAIKATYRAKLKVLRNGRPPDPDPSVVIITDWRELAEFPEIDRMEDE